MSLSISIDMDKDYNPCGIVTFRFLNQDNKISNKGYDFLVDDREYDFLTATYGTKICLNSFRIVNNKDYDYNLSRVVVEELRLIKESDNIKSLSSLKQIELVGPEECVIHTPKIEFKPISQVFTTKLGDVGRLSSKCGTALESLTTTIQSYTDIEERGSNKMFKNVMKNVKFGKADNVKMSIYGPAFLSYDFNAGIEFYAYDTKTETYIDVSNMLLDMDNCCYMMPVSEKDIKLNDFIFYNGAWCRIINFDNAGRPVVENIYTKEVVTILPIKNIFGFNFYTKLISFVDGMFNASTDNPFGNLLPLLMMKESDNDKNMLPILLMMNGGKIGEMNLDMSNPMFMYMMMGDNDSITDMMLMMTMMNMNNSKDQPKEK